MSSVGDLGNINPVQLQESIINQTNMEEVDDIKEQVSGFEPGKHDEQRLKEEIANFTAFFVKQMFDAMRDTVPESDLIDGGFAEDVFTDMLDQEISEQGARQTSFKKLNELLFEQLNR